MVFAASKTALRRALEGIGAEIQGTDASEVAYDTGAQAYHFLMHRCLNAFAHPVLEKVSKGN